MRDLKLSNHTPRAFRFTLLVHLTPAGRKYQIADISMNKDLAGFGSNDFLSGDSPVKRERRAFRRALNERGVLVK